VTGLEGEAEIKIEKPQVSATSAEALRYEKGIRKVSVPARRTSTARNRRQRSPSLLGEVLLGEPSSGES
jgi:hypothetical protein